jgi:hypothetical protein
VIVGVAAAFVLGDAAAANSKSGQTRTWVAVFDVVTACLLLLYVVRMLRRPRDAEHEKAAINKMSKVASSPAIAIVAAGATLANPGAFIPIALKEISQLQPSTAAYAITLDRLRPRITAPAACCARRLPRAGDLSPACGAGLAWATRERPCRSADRVVGGRAAA